MPASVQGGECHLQQQPLLAGEKKKTPLLVTVSAIRVTLPAKKEP